MKNKKIRFEECKHEFVYDMTTKHGLHKRNKYTCIHCGYVVWV